MSAEGVITLMGELRDQIGQQAVVIAQARQLDEQRQGRIAHLEDENGDLRRRLEEYEPTPPPEPTPEEARIAELEQQLDEANATLARLQSQP